MLAIHSGIDSTFLPAPSDVGHALVGSRGQILLQVITPYIIPSIIDAFQINISTSYFLEFSSCCSTASEGLGKRILLAQKFFKTDEIFACLIVLGLIGFALDLSFRLLLRFTCQWAFD